MTLPPWLQRHLQNTGAWNTDGISRTARAHPCKHCHRLTLTGLDADRAAAPAHIDPTPLTPLGETLALAGNLHTYTLHWTGEHLEIDGPRDATNITHHPAGTDPRTDVVAQHTCTPTHLPSKPSTHTRPGAATTDGPPPF